MTFTDEYSRYSTVIGISKKSEVANVFGEYMIMFENQTGKTIKAVRSDNGGEFMGEFAEILRKKGIRHFRTVPHAPWQNGIAERLNRTLLEGARSMLFERKLPKNMWELAVKHMCYVKNRIPGPNGIPLKIMKGESMRFELMWPFGIRIWYKKTNAGKLDEKAELGTYVGVAANQKGVLVQNKFGKIIVTRDYKVAGETQRIDHVEEKSTDLTRV